jgi:ribosomal protein S27E
MSCVYCNHICIVLYGSGTRWYWCPECGKLVEYPYQFLR